MGSLSNLRIYYAWKNVKTSYKNSKFKASAPTFELPDGSYSVSDIQDYFEYIFKNMEKRLCINKMEKRITFKIKT